MVMKFTIYIRPYYNDNGLIYLFYAIPDSNSVITVLLTTGEGRTTSARPDKFNMSILNEESVTIRLYSQSFTNLPKSFTLKSFIPI